jgi:phage anti-repressor protein
MRRNLPLKEEMRRFYSRNLFRFVDEKIPSHELFYEKISACEFIHEKEYPVRSTGTHQNS